MIHPAQTVLAPHFVRRCGTRRANHFPDDFRVDGGWGLNLKNYSHKIHVSKFPYSLYNKILTQRLA